MAAPGLPGPGLQGAGREGRRGWRSRRLHRSPGSCSPAIHRAPLPARRRTGFQARLTAAQCAGLAPALGHAPQRLAGVRPPASAPRCSSAMRPSLPAATAPGRRPGARRRWAQLWGVRASERALERRVLRALRRIAPVLAQRPQQRLLQVIRFRGCQGCARRCPGSARAAGRVGHRGGAVAQPAGSGPHSWCSLLSQGI